MVNSYLSNMLEKTNGPTALWTKIQIIINDNAVAAVVEGKDYQYYGYHIRTNNFVPTKSVSSVNTHGRHNLISLIDYLVDKGEQLSNMLFFLDNELPSQRFENSYCFVTSVNSVENYYVSTSAFSKLIENHTSISKKYSEFLLKKFEDSLQVFNNSMIDIGIFLDTCLKMGLDPKLKKFDIKIFFNFQNLKIVPAENSFSKLLDYFVVRCDDVTQTKLKTIINETKKEICQNEKMKYVRGKYAMSFLQYFLSAIKKSEQNSNKDDDELLSYYLSKDKKNDEVINDWQDISDCDPFLKEYIFKMTVEISPI